MSFTTRLLVATLCAVSLAIAGVSLERVGPRAVDVGSPRPAISGAWSCPHGGGDGWRAWVTVTNPGPEPVEIRRTTSAGGTATAATPGVIEPGTLQYFEVEAPLPGSATAVEYLGGLVVAGSVVVAPEGGLAAAPCARNPGTVWHTVESSSLRGETAWLVVHNPFAAQAVVDVILTAGERQIRPGRLQGVVLGPLSARAFELNNFALGEEALAATILAPQGRVAAASVVLSASGARSSLAVPAARTRWLLPGAGRETDVVVRALASQDSPVSAQLHGEGGGVPAIDLEAVSAATAEAFGVLEAEGGLLVVADGPRPMLAGRRMVLAAQAPAPQREPAGKGRKDGKERRGDRGGRGSGGGRERGGKKQAKEHPAPPAPDIAATEGAAAPSDRWVVPPPVLPQGGPSVVLIQNPGEEEVEATVTLLGIGGGGVAPTTLAVPPHATVRLPVPGEGPVAALVEGRGLVAAQASPAAGAFSVILGLPLL